MAESGVVQDIIGKLPPRVLAVFVGIAILFLAGLLFTGLFLNKNIDFWGVKISSAGTGAVDSSASKSNVTQTKLKLEFGDTQAAANPFDSSLQIRCFVDDDLTGKLLGASEVLRGSGGLSVRMSNIRQGSKISLQVTQGGRSWISDDWIVPESNIKMNIQQ